MLITPFNSPPTPERYEHFRGAMYERENYPLYWFVRKVLSQVNFADPSQSALSQKAAEGVVVYALKGRSQLNSLILRELARRFGVPSPVYAHGVNMITWQPLPEALKALRLGIAQLWRRRNPEEESDYLKKLAMAGKSVIIHLGDSEFFDDEEADAALGQLIDAQREMPVPVYIVPELVTYGRRREKERESFFNILFGQIENVGGFRRMVTFLRYARKVFTLTVEPLNLSEYLEKNKNRSRLEMIEQIRRELIERIDEERESIVGPVLKSRPEMIQSTMDDPGVARKIDELGRRGKPSVPALRKEARKYLHEIASDYNEMFIELWEKLLSWLWNNIYDGVVLDQEGIVKIRNLSKKMPFVIIPCHRSHIDYLLLSYVFYKHNIQMPFVAAGTNLSFFPLGFIFRKSGAFFLRRTFRGNELYSEVFSGYLRTLIREGLPIEFFIEGGRSRTGKMVMPKYGILSMIIQAYLDGACDNMAAIPVYIGYDRIVEEKSYLKELGGAPKDTEKTADIIRSGKVLKKRYGHVYVNIGEPILLKEYLASQEKPVLQMSVEERQSLYRKIGYGLVLEIAKVAVVTPFSLVAAGLLSSDRRGITQDDLINTLNRFHDYLSYRNVRFAETFSNRAKAIQEALVLFEQSDLISRLGSEEEDEDVEAVVYSLEDDKRMNLEYYKNNILHFFLPISFVAVSMLAAGSDLISLNQLMVDYRFFKRLFRHEFIFDDSVDDAEEVKDVLSWLHRLDLVIAQERDGEAWLEMRGMARKRLRPFAGLIENYIESYWVVARGCGYLRKQPRPEKDFVKKLHRLGGKMHRMGEIRRAESLSQSNYINAITYLRNAEILRAVDPSDKADRKDSRTYALSGERSGLETLRRRLFKFL